LLLLPKQSREIIRVIAGFSQAEGAWLLSRSALGKAKLMVSRVPSSS
jgi:hypothetical protein